jgi:monofunctional biosynthetic peptidoglycan transglycosylase
MTTQPLRILLDFDSAADVALFSPIDDVVMGGVSSSRLVQAAPGIAAFEGTVSLENRGGFASVRTRSREWDTQGAKEFVLRLRSDGKRYRFNVRTPNGPDAFRYEAALELPEGTWTEVGVPIAAFRAKAFGQSVPFAGSPDPARIQSLGFMISDRQAGPFRLEIDWIACR